MGKGRGKWKRQATVAAHENSVSGGEEKTVPLKRRGRPLKNSKKESEEKEEMKTTIDEVVIENVKVAEENGKKRKNSLEIEEGLDSTEEEISAKTSAIVDDSVKLVGFRQSGSRRKSKPRRAAEVGVECYCY